MVFSSYFRFSSYMMLICSTLTLAVSGGIGVALFLAFLFLIIIAWRLEGTKWQLSEKVGLVVVILSLPLFYVDWRYLSNSGEARDRVGVSALAHLILFLSAVKLLQAKADRDWVFIYLISFFEVLLAAGLSISPLYLVTLSIYLTFALSTIIAFEIKKASQSVVINETKLMIAQDSTFWRRLKKKDNSHKKTVAKRLPLVACGLLLVIFALAMPLFFVMPRYGASASANSRRGFSGMQVGFSDSVSLGTIGELKQGNQIVMRVRVDNAITSNLRWRGVALDEFTGKGWRKSGTGGWFEVKSQNSGLIQLGTLVDAKDITVQTFYLEPLDSNYLFGAPRIVAVALNGEYNSLMVDGEKAITISREDNERTTYKIYSETKEPSAEILREDNEPYSVANVRYLQLPNNLNPQIGELTREIINNSKARNRYDKVRAVESYLQTQFGYSLDMKAGKDNKDDPLSDFLFNIREGHCEYFASSMVVMLRTQGIAARLVNGFQTGEYNDATDAYTVTQSEAHSWVEVYFPNTKSWVTFDPTPPAGTTLQTKTGLRALVGKYADALEMMWIQYIVGYDNQEQRSLASSFTKKLYSFQAWISEKYENAKKWTTDRLKAIRGLDEEMSPFEAFAQLCLFFGTLVISIIIAVVLIKRIRFALKERAKRKSVIEFYERMVRLLAKHGFRRADHETPLEFANEVGYKEAVLLTHAYNRVRFGGKVLTQDEAKKVEVWLSEMEAKT